MMTVSHTDVRQWLLAPETLSLDQLAALQAHLEGCVECQAFAALHQAMRQEAAEFRSQSGARLRADPMPRVLAELPQKTRRQRMQKQVMGWLQTTAVVLMLLGGGLLIGLGGRRILPQPAVGGNGPILQSTFKQEPLVSTETPAAAGTPTQAVSATSTPAISLEPTLPFNDLGDGIPGNHEPVITIPPTEDIETLVRNAVTAYKLAWSPNGHWLVMGTMRGLRFVDTRVWGEPVELIGGPEFYSDEMAFAGDLLAVTLQDGVRVWDLATQQLVFELDGQPLEFQSVALSPDGSLLATGEGSPEMSSQGSSLAGGSGRIRLWDLATGEAVGELPVGGTFVADMGFSPDGLRLTAALQWQARVEVWDVPTRQLAYSFEIGQDVIRFTLSPDAQRIIVDYGQPGFDLWSVESQRSLHYYPLAIGAEGWVAFSADGQRVMVWGERSQDGQSVATIWSLEPEEMLQAMSTGPAYLFEYQGGALNPDGTLVATSTTGGIVSVDRVRSPEGEVWHTIMKK